ncbi:hypothetical protein ACFL96_10835 [Thermoproteota archaeon]
MFKLIAILEKNRGGIKNKKEKGSDRSKSHTNPFRTLTRSFTKMRMENYTPDTKKPKALKTITDIAAEMKTLDENMVSVIHLAGGSTSSINNIEISNKKRVTQTEFDKTFKALSTMIIHLRQVFMFYFSKSMNLEEENKSETPEEKVLHFCEKLGRVLDAFASNNTFKSENLSLTKLTVKTDELVSPMAYFIAEQIFSEGLSEKHDHTKLGSRMADCLEKTENFMDSFKEQRNLLQGGQVLIGYWVNKSILHHIRNLSADIDSTVTGKNKPVVAVFHDDRSIPIGNKKTYDHEKLIEEYNELLGKLQQLYNPYSNTEKSDDDKDAVLADKFQKLMRITIVMMNFEDLFNDLKTNSGLKLGMTQLFKHYAVYLAGRAFDKDYIGYSVENNSASDIFTTLYEFSKIFFSDVNPLEPILPFPYLLAEQCFQKIIAAFNADLDTEQGAPTVNIKGRFIDVDSCERALRNMSQLDRFCEVTQQRLQVGIGPLSFTEVFAEQNLKKDKEAGTSGYSAAKKSIQLWEELVKAEKVENRDQMKAYIKSSTSRSVTNTEKKALIKFLDKNQGLTIGQFNTISKDTKNIWLISQLMKVLHRNWQHEKNTKKQGLLTGLLNKAFGGEQGNDQKKTDPRITFVTAFGKFINILMEDISDFVTNALLDDKLCTIQIKTKKMNEDSVLAILNELSESIERVKQRLCERYPLAVESNDFMALIGLGKSEEANSEGSDISEDDKKKKGKMTKKQRKAKQKQKVANEIKSNQISESAMDQQLILTVTRELNDMKKSIEATHQPMNHSKPDDSQIEVKIQDLLITLKKDRQEFKKKKENSELSEQDISQINENFKQNIPVIIKELCNAIQTLIPVVLPSIAQILCLYYPYANFTNRMTSEGAFKQIKDKLAGRDNADLNNNHLYQFLNTDQGQIMTNLFQLLSRLEMPLKELLKYISEENFPNERQQLIEAAQTVVKANIILNQVQSIIS